MTPATYWCERAVVDGRVADSIVLEVVDGRFGAVHPARSAPAGAIRLAGLSVPGLANAHSHAFHRALRSRVQAERGSFWTWRDTMYRAACRLDPERYHRLARATFAEMALAGVTAVGEFHYVHHQADGTPHADPNAMGEALFAAAADAGIRITLLDAVYLHGGLGPDGYRPVEGGQRRFSDGTADAWAARVDRLRPGHGQRVGAAIHSVRAVDPTAMRAVAEWAHERAAPIHVHVSEQPVENEQCRAAHGMTPTALLAAAGVLGAQTTAIHATHLGAGDVALLADSGTGVCVCPTTERDLGDGIGPTAELAAAGVALSLGSDSHAVIDLLEEARAVELDERLRSQARGVHTAERLLAAATFAGQASLGWADAGTIAVGARADLVAIGLDSVRTAGAGAAVVEAAVFAATAADVTDVIVDGNPVVRGGRHVGLDVGRELADAIAEVLVP